MALTQDRNRRSVYRVRDLPDWIPARRRALGDRIAHFRYRANLTQLAASEAAGIPHRTYQRIERGESDPRFTDLLLIAHILEVPVTALLDDGAPPVCDAGAPADGRE